MPVSVVITSGRLLVILTVLLGPFRFSQARNSLGLDAPGAASNSTDPCICQICNRVRNGYIYCSSCQAGDKGPRKTDCVCDGRHCLVCNGRGKCMQCKYAYRLQFYSSLCAESYWPTAGTQGVPITSSYEPPNTDYSTTYSMGFFPVALVCLLVIWIMRRLRYRQTPVFHEISMRHITSEPTVTGTAPNDAGENLETSPLLSPNEGERPANMNSVLVVGPGGNIDVGVAENDDKTKQEERHGSE